MLQIQTVVMVLLVADHGVVAACMNRVSDEHGLLPVTALQATLRGACTRLHVPGTVCIQSAAVSLQIDVCQISSNLCMLCSPLGAVVLPS